MKSQIPGMSTRPHLYIETQFSQEQESQNLGHFQFQPKDVISEASSYQMHDRNPENNIRMLNRAPSDNKKLIVAGLVSLDFTFSSWRINATLNAFELIKQIKPTQLYSYKVQKYQSKQLQQCKSVANLRNSNSILNRGHSRKNSGSSQRDLQRAQVLNQIITKLNSRQKSSKAKSLAKSQPKSLTQSHKSVQKKFIVKQKLKKLQNILKDYKLQHQQSTQKSTVYFTKHHQKINKINKQEEQSELLEDSKIEQNQIKVGTFKKLKNDIMHVKNQVNQLKQINQIYRRQNNMLKNRTMEDNPMTGRQSYYSSDRQSRHQPISMNYQNPIIYQPIPQIQSTLLPNYPINYSPQMYYSPPPPIYQPQPSPQYASHFTQNYSPAVNSSHHKSTHHLRQYLQPISTYRQDRCRDARHEHYWKTMIPQNIQMNISNSNAKDQPIVFCFKCGCKCAQKDDRLNITERKDYASSSVNRFKNLF